MVQFLLLAFSAVTVWAGSISGVVIDPSGASIQNSKVIVVGENGDRRERRRAIA
jgi:hypothetical protein